MWSLSLNRTDTWYVCKFSSRNLANKEVLLRERKRHTARRVASARFADRRGYPIHSWMGGGGYTHQVLTGGLPRGTPHPDLGTPVWTWDGVPPPSLPRRCEQTDACECGMRAVNIRK